MSRMSVTCNKIEKEIQDISGMGGHAENIVCKVYEILKALHSGEIIDETNAMGLLDDIGKYNVDLAYRPVK